MICSISLRTVLFLAGRLEGDDDLKHQEDFPRGHMGRTQSIWTQHTEPILKVVKLPLVCSINGPGGLEHYVMWNRKGVNA